MSNPSPDVVEAGTVLAGRYRIERQLGKGGMGSVYLVEHVHTEQRLALKLLHAAVVSDEVALARFRREARAPARVDSDHVVKVTDADVAPELGGVPFLVMEWLRGQSLEDLVNERGALPPEDVVLYLRQAARALDKAHALGIVHRDLKPENLFLTTREDGTPCLKILDFGIAKLTQGGDEGRLKATGTGQIFGTPLYMSPEQTKAELDKISPRSDLWALGIVAHRLLLGREPWTATNLTGLIGQIAYEPLPVPSKADARFGAAFDAWFARCCAREPEDRFATAGEVVAALAKALGTKEEGVQSAPVAGASAPASPSPAQAQPTLDATPPPRPVRDEVDRTAFSATAPAPMPSVPRQAGKAKARRSRLALAIFAAAITVAAAIGSGLYVSRQQGGPRPVSSPLALPVAPSVTATAAALPPSEAVSGAAPIAVTPATSALPRAEEPPPTPTSKPLASHRVAHPPPAPPIPKTAAPTPAPTPAAPAPPPKPEDPLGTRH